MFSKVRIQKPKFSFIEKLRQEGKSSEEFELMLNNLTLEELIWLKLEISSKTFVNNKYFGLPLYKSMPYIFQYALVQFAVATSPTMRQAARILGISELNLKRIIRNKFNHLDQV